MHFDNKKFFIFIVFLVYIMNNTTKVSFSPFHRSHITIISQVTSLVLLGVVIILGNLAPIVTFIKTRSLRRKSHYLLICLSVADCGVGVVTLLNVPFFLNIFLGAAYIRCLDIMDTLTGFASIITLVVVSVERFYAVFFPLRHLTTRFKFYAGLASFPWCIACFIAGFNDIFTNSFIVYGYLINITIVTCLLVIVFNYVTIGVKAFRIQSSSFRDRHLVVILLIVTLSSIVTWLPVQCLSAVLIFCRTCQNPHINVFYAMKFLQFSNSGINIFVYILRMNEFRSAFLVLFCRKKKYREHVSVQELTQLKARSTIA